MKTETTVASVNEKVVKIRKGLKCSNGKPLVQRDFAKFIDYLINKYAEAEKIDRWGVDEESPVEDIRHCDILYSNLLNCGKWCTMTILN